MYSEKYDKELCRSGANSISDVYNNNITTHENLFLVFHDWIIILLNNIIMYNTKFWFWHRTTHNNHPSAPTEVIEHSNLKD